MIAAWTMAAPGVGGKTGRKVTKVSRFADNSCDFRDLKQRNRIGRWKLEVMVQNMPWRRVCKTSVSRRLAFPCRQTYPEPMAADSNFHLPRFGRERLSPGKSIARHRHEEGYVTVVLSGGYQEAGLDGRRNLVAGDVVVHRPFDAHRNDIGTMGTELLNLPLPPGLSLPAAFRTDGPDALARLAERNPLDAASQLLPGEEIPSQSDWPDELALALTASQEQKLGDWAAAAGLAAESLSRGFRAAYGITPARFRADLRARRAMELIGRGGSSLAAIALDCGYADQAHLNRAIVGLTGLPPGAWRKSNSFKNSHQMFA